MRKTLVALLLLAVPVACGPPSAGEPTVATEAGGDAQGAEEAAEAPAVGAEGRQPTMQERLVIRDLSHMAERVRGLSFHHDVHTEVHGAESIVAHLTQQLEEEALEASRLTYVALGLLPPDMDVRAMLERVLGEQVVGFYDHEQDRLVIRDDVMRALGSRGGGRAVDEAKVTIVHELVHALQDQRLGLGARIEEEADSDPETAYQAVVEGDATLAMIGYVAEQAGGRLEWITQDPDRIRALTRTASASPIPDQELQAAPAIVRVTLVSAYLDGLVFAATLHGNGGWRAVDMAHERPPVSTEQILHPDLYLARELPDEVEVPELGALTDAGLESHDDDVLGELEMSIYFGQGEPGGVDEEAAAGWSGDHLRVYAAPDGTHPVVWLSAWDDEDEAKQAETAAKRVGDALEGDAAARQLVLRRGRGLLIVRHLDPALHAPVRRAFRTFADQLPSLPPRG